MTQNTPQQYFGEINVTLEELIQCQRNEREIILNRDTANLPALCSRINTLASALNQKQSALEKVCEDVPEDCRAIARECKNKFSLLHELALQNHVLVESNVKFLEDVFQQVFGGKHRPDIYNALGIRNKAIGASGHLVNLKV